MQKYAYHKSIKVLYALIYLTEAQNEATEAIIEDGDVWDGVDDKDVIQDFDQPIENVYVHPPSPGSPIKTLFHEKVVLFLSLLGK